MNFEKIKYLFRSILNFNQHRKCPSCGYMNLEIIDRKYYFTILFECSSCLLNFRFPTDSKKFLNNYYQNEYKANYSDISKKITDLPSNEELSELMNLNFPGRRNYEPFILSLTNTQKIKILDYGCSWGYSVFQLKKSGFDAEGFEISKPRAIYGKKINVTIHSEHDKINSNLDFIVSNHTIEHLPVISDFISLVKEKLNNEGILMFFCPNGSPEYRKKAPQIHHVNWGFLHPNYLTVEYVKKLFKNNPYLILTDDWNYNLSLLSNWDGMCQIVGEKLNGQELLVISKPNIKI